MQYLKKRGIAGFTAKLVALVVFFGLAAIMLLGADNHDADLYGYVAILFFIPFATWFAGYLTYCVVEFFVQMLKGIAGMDR